MSKPAKPSPRVHPDEQGRIAGLNAMAAWRGDVPKSPEPLSYYTPILIQCTLPHSDPKTNVWRKKNGEFSLTVQGGVDQDGNPYGVPYGSFPRLGLAHIVTQAIKAKERRIELGSSFSGFLHQLGYRANLRGISSDSGAAGVREQLLRLLTSRLSYQREIGDDERRGIAGGNMNIASGYELWWNEKKPDQACLWNSYVYLSQDFLDSILAAPVPLKTSILKDLHKSPMAIDVYMWASYRLFTMRQAGHESIHVSYGQLHNQFGTGIASENYRKFRQSLKTAFGKVANHWRDDTGKSLLHHGFDRQGLTLFRSPHIVGKARDITAKKPDWEAILASSAFDQDTRRAARQIAGNWDLDWLEQQYFGWLEQEGIVSHNPRAHFLKFIKVHRQRNGDLA